MAIACKHTFRAGDSVRYNKLYLDEYSTDRRSWYGTIGSVLPNGETIVVRWFNRGAPIELGYIHHTWLEKIDG